MERSTLLEQLAHYNQLYNKTDDNTEVAAILPKMETLLENYLLTHKDDTEMWFALALVQHTVPGSEPSTVINTLNRILSYDSNNVKAVVFKAFILYCATELDVVTFNTLIKTTSLDNKEQALLYYAASWYYYMPDDPKKAEYLIKSIESFSCFPNAHIDLARYYHLHKMYEKACYHYGESLIHIESSYPPVGWINLIDIYEQIAQITGCVKFVGHIEKLTIQYAECRAALYNLKN